MNIKDLGNGGITPVLDLITGAKIYHLAELDTNLNTVLTRNIIASQVYLNKTQN